MISNGSNIVGDCVKQSHMIMHMRIQPDFNTIYIDNYISVYSETAMFKNLLMTINALMSINI